MHSAFIRSTASKEVARETCDAWPDAPPRDIFPRLIVLEVLLLLLEALEGCLLQAHQAMQHMLEIVGKRMFNIPGRHRGPPLLSTSWPVHLHNASARCVGAAVFTPLPLAL